MKDKIIQAERIDGFVVTKKNCEANGPWGPSFEKAYAGPFYDLWNCKQDLKDDYQGIALKVFGEKNVISFIWITEPYTDRSGISAPIDPRVNYEVNCFGENAEES